MTYTTHCRALGGAAGGRGRQAGCAGAEPDRRGSRGRAVAHHRAVLAAAGEGLGEHCGFGTGGADAGRAGEPAGLRTAPGRSEEHTSELQSLMRISYVVFCLQKKNNPNTHHITYLTTYIPSPQKTT